MNYIWAMVGKICASGFSLAVEGEVVLPDFSRLRAGTHIEMVSDSTGGNDAFDMDEEV